ncbi:hybrid sensor histidine kinase/response regulator [Azospirillum brasilense]|uniref:hybrid sensor histidine kinase/response regulator n=1 Tax=Azospirillum brasilense TaxID=192 RepID=UPI000E0B6964|nr:hybrid sensor histidine kinase/response regulator [Azospirillum brasilense]
MIRLSVNALLNFHPKAILATIVLVMTLLGGVAWGALSLVDYVSTLDRAERGTRQAAAFLEGHADAVLDGGAAALARVADRLEAGGMASLPDHALGEALAASRFGALSILDAGGNTVFGPSIHPDGGIPDGGIASLFRGAEGGLELLHGQVDGLDSILMVRRILRRGGAGEGILEGAILLALPSSSLHTVLDVFSDGRHSVAGLFRLDGTRLAGIGGDGAGIGPLPALEPGEEGGEGDWTVGGDGVVIGLKRMRDFPAVAAVALPRSVVLEPWSGRLQHGFTMVGVSVLALFGLASLGWASLRREAAARDALRDANARLEQRVEERTADLRSLNQKLVRALAEKERANQAKARFLSAANHDLRQPFQALRLFHHLLMERLKESRERSIAEKMGEALDSGEKLLHALLEVATLDAGVVRPNIADVPVATVLDGVAAEFRGLAADKTLDLRVRGCAAMVRTDATLLTRMLGDLLRNAIAYTPAGGVVVGCRRRGQWLRIEVWDTGSGIAAEHLDAIFEDFVQLGNPERDRRRGLGLGLPKVRRKAALLGHAVEVRSRPGQGSVFSIMVPLAASESRTDTVSPAPAGRAEGSDTRLILIVEDDPVQSAGMQLLLESWGHDILVAADGPAALATLRAAPRCPDVILSDFRLPGPLTGAETIARAAEQQGRPIPGIILTGDTAPERIREAVAAGCRLLHKPVTPDVLRDALNALGTERQPLRQPSAA